MFRMIAYCPKCKRVAFDLKSVTYIGRVQTNCSDCRTAFHIQIEGSTHKKGGAGNNGREMWSGNSNTARKAES